MAAQQLALGALAALLTTSAVSAGPLCDTFGCTKAWVDPPTSLLDSPSNGGIRLVRIGDAVCHIDLDAGTIACIA